MPGFIAIHLGAGQHSEALWPQYRKLCHRACRKGTAVLTSGGSALEAATVATAVLEDSPLTNAGYGSNLTWDGQVECDAGVMDGHYQHYGAVGAVQGVKNPVVLAQHICQKQSEVSFALGRIPPCLVVGNGARKWAKHAGLQVVPAKNLISDKAFRRYKHYKKKLEKYEAQVNKIIGPLDTVGAVCIDSCGQAAAACSSGGVALKHPGRVGQVSGRKRHLGVHQENRQWITADDGGKCLRNMFEAAVFGSGCWASNYQNNMPAIASCSSGGGEYLIRTMLAREVAMEIQKSSCAVTGLHNVMKTQFLESPCLREVDGKLGGVLVLKYSPDEGGGECLWAHSTSTMCVAYMKTEDKKPVSHFSQLSNGHIAGKNLVVEGITFRSAAINTNVAELF